MAEKRRSKTFDEFIINKEDVKKIEDKWSKIEHMYSVKIEYGQEIEGKRWIRLNGEHGDRKCAKEYILAICHPQETIKYQYPPIFDSKFNSKELLEEIEKHNNAVIEKCPNGSQLLIMGSQMNVTMAWSRIEMLIEHNNKGTVSGLSNITADSLSQTRLDSNLQRVLSQNSDGDSIKSIQEYSNVNNSVKSVILKTLTRYSDEEDFTDSDLFASGPDQQKSYAIPIFMTDSGLTQQVVADAAEDNLIPGNFDNEKGQDMNKSPVTSTRSRKQSYLYEIGRSSGFGEDCIEKALYYITEDSKPDEFLSILNVINSQGEPIEDSVDSPSPDASPLYTIESSSKDDNKAKGRELPNEYMQRLLVDFDEEESGLSVEELKRKNEERQKILKSQIVAKEKETSASQKKKKKNQQSKKNESKGITRRDRIFITDKDDTQNLDQSVGGLKLADDSKPTPLYLSNTTSEGIVPGKNSSPYKFINNTVVETANPNLFYMTPQKFQQSDGNKLSDHSNPTNITPTINYPQTSNTSSSSYSRSPKGSFIPSNSNSSPRVRHHSSSKEFSQNRNFQHPKTQEEETCVMKIWDGTNMETGSSPRKQTSKSPARSKKGYSQSPRKIAAVQPTVIGRQPASREVLPLDSYDLRYVVVDGSNVAMTHGNGQVFSCKGLKLCVDFFLRRGHNVTVFVPEWRKYTPGYRNQILDQEILHDLKDSGHLVFTPSRKVRGKLIVSYDDRYILQLAEDEEGIIVSNDNYRDLMSESTTWKRIIEERLLMYAFAGNSFMPAPDPLGRDGPKLNDFLKKPRTQTFENFSEDYRNVLPPDEKMWYQQQQQSWEQKHQQKWQPVSPLHQCGNFDYDQPAETVVVRDSGSRNYSAKTITQNSPNFKPAYSEVVGGPSPGKGRGQTPNKHSQQKSSKICVTDQPIRSKAESQRLLAELKQLFPEDYQEVKIRTVLDNHRKERDISRLTNYCLNIMTN